MIFRRAHTDEFLSSSIQIPEFQDFLREDKTAFDKAKHKRLGQPAGIRHLSSGREGS